VAAENTRLQKSDDQEGTTKKLLILTAVVEWLTGLFLLVCPAIVVRLLFGSQIAGADVLISRIAGIALIALGVACWPGRNSHQAFLGMLTYGALVMLYLAYVGLNRATGILLWPCVAIHLVLSVLLVRAWRKERHLLESAKSQA